MKRVILRFLKNKAIEIWKNLLYLVKWTSIIGVCVVGFFTIMYLIGLWLVRYPWLADIMDFPEINQYGDLVFCGLATIITFICCAAACVIVPMFIYIGIVEFVGWIRENWQRAKREIKDEQKLQETNTKR